MKQLKTDLTIADVNFIIFQLTQAYKNSEVMTQKTFDELVEKLYRLQGQLND